MTNLPRERATSEIVKRGYSNEELSHIFALARLHIESGALKAAETVLSGLNEVAPDFSPGWLGMAYLHLLQDNKEGAIAACRNSFRVDPESMEVLLFSIACALIDDDINAAGSFLGEVQERLDAGVDVPHDLVRIYRMQLARYQARSGQLVE